MRLVGFFHFFGLLGVFQKLDSFLHVKFLYHNP